jgi:ribosomal protein S18 acetylase RimI-like enzyme
VDVLIEKARVRDAEQILKLQYLCFQSEGALYDDYTIPPLTQTLASLLAEYDTHLLLSARRGDEVVGSIRGQLIEGTCHVGRLMVHPRLQRQGLGERLVRALEGHFGAAERFEIFTGDRSAGNIRLYRRLGYIPFREATLRGEVHLVYLAKEGSRPCLTPPCRPA